MFVGRRADGSIYGTWTCRQPSDADHYNIEELPDNHPDVAAFVAAQVIPDPRAAIVAALDSARTVGELTTAIKQALRL